jgi:protein import protein ZIM17
MDMMTVQRAFFSS